MNRKLCFKCGYIWWPRTKKPKKCPKCGSRTWFKVQAGKKGVDKVVS